MVAGGWRSFICSAIAGCRVRPDPDTDTSPGLGYPDLSYLGSDHFGIIGRSIGLTDGSDVGRVSDWHKAASTSGAATTASTPTPSPCASEDPGVLLTAGLKDFFVANGFATEVMAASFRNAGQVAALAGCDHLTIGMRGGEKKEMEL